MVHDLVIVGAGPAGLAAAINGASEGLSVALLDRALELGGQAKESACIENYPLPVGDYRGVTGAEMMQGFAAQAERFGTVITAPASVTRLVPGITKFDSFAGTHKIITDDFQEFEAHTVMLSMGLAWRRLRADGLARFMGRGVYYGAPPMVKARSCAVVGGANSAGQAVIRLAKQCKNVLLLARSPIANSMSQYLVDRIKTFDNIEVIEGAEVVAVEGRDHLEGVSFTVGGGEIATARHHDIDKLFIFIGAVPHTGWLHGVVDLNPKGFILTDGELPPEHRKGVSPCATNVPGVFAAGDIRLGQGVKRITGAVFDGVCAIQSIHHYLAGRP